MLGKITSWLVQAVERGRWWTARRSGNGQQPARRLARAWRQERTRRQEPTRRRATTRVWCGERLEGRWAMAGAGTGAQAGTQAGSGGSSMSLGMNLESVADWSPAWTFTDAFRSSRPWISQAYNTVTGTESWEGGGPVHVDARGWPTALNQFPNAQGQLIQQRLGTLLFRDVGTDYPAGVYRAEWQGSGTLSWGFAARAIEEGTMPSGTHYALLNVQPSTDGIYLQVSQLSTADPIRNIHVWMPDYQGRSFAGQAWQPGASFSPFHPLFLERLAPFKTLRFMDWAETNGSDVTSWNSRRPWDAATQQSGDLRTGVALEYMIELANELDADPWFNMPYQASDDFVRNFAIQVRDTLEPGRKVYVEWANETWNAGYGFEVYPWITAQLSRPENAALQGDRWALVAQETRRDFAIWSEVFAGQSQRLARVVAGQEANSWIAQQIASHMQGQFDALSAAAYAFVSDTDRAAFRATTTADQVIDALLRNLPTTVRWLTEHRQLADEFAAQLGRPIELVAYEGGPHLDSWGAAYEPAFFAAGASPRMYDVYAQLLDGAARSGVNRFVNYNYTGGRYASSFGAFGALQAQNQPLAQAPKYRALLDFAPVSPTPPPPNPPPPTPPPPTTVPGLLGQYFDNRDFTAPKMTRVDSHLNFNWGLGAPDPALERDTFSVRWTGQLRVPQTGSYQFRTYSDEGIRLTLGGVTRIDNFKSHLGMYNSSAVLSLTAGQLVDVQLEYFENTGRAAVKLEWKRPGKAGFGQIPLSQLQTLVATSPASINPASINPASINPASINPASINPASAGQPAARLLAFDAVAMPTVPPISTVQATIKANGYCFPTCNERTIVLDSRRRRRASTHS